MTLMTNERVASERENLAELFGFTKPLELEISHREVTRPKISSASVDVKSKFSKMEVEIDPIFQNFLDSWIKDYDLFTDGARRYVYFQSFGNEDGSIHTFCNIKDWSLPREILGNIDFLSRNFDPYLRIPKHGDEVNFILGYALINSHPFVLYLKHEIKTDWPRIHLCAKRVNMWAGEYVRGFAKGVVESETQVLS